MFAMGNNKTTNVRVIKLVMVETGTYNEQYCRPYNTSVDGTVMGVITDRINRGAGASFNASALSGIAGTFISPQAAPESSIGIINGWGERRIRFLLEVECTQLGGTKTAYIQGFTNFMGVTASGATAPDMEFYINSITYTRKMYRQTPFGMQIHENVIDNSHLLYNNAWSNAFQPGQTRLMRPQDIYKTISLSHLPGVFDQSISGVFDTTSVLRSEAVKSKRSNGLACNYAAGIIDSYCTASELSAYGQSENKILDQSREQVMEGVAGADPFIMALMSVTGGHINNKFKYSDLMSLDLNTDNVATFNVASPAQQRTTHTAGSTSNWHGSNRNTTAASVLSQAVPAIMMDLMIKKIVFKSTNHAFGSQAVTTILAGESFTNMEMEPIVNLFIKRLELEVIQNLTYGGQDSYYIEMRVDLLGETWISIAMCTEPVTDFVTPSFCDALFAPIITNNAETLSGVSNDFSKLIDGVREVINDNKVGGSISMSV